MAGWIISTSTSQGDAVACSLKTRDLNCNQSDNLISLMEHTPLQQNRYSTIEILVLKCLLQNARDMYASPNAWKKELYAFSHMQKESYTF